MLLTSVKENETHAIVDSRF